MNRALLTDIDGWLIAVAFFVTTGSLIWVHTFWRWWAAPLGRSYMSVKALLALALLPGTLQKLGVPVSGIGFLWYFTATFMLLIPVIAWRAAVLWQLQRHPLGSSGWRRPRKTESR